MLQLIKYNIIVKFRDFNVIFWPLFFPIILGTLFYFAFGNMDGEDFVTIPVAVVMEEDENNEGFAAFLEEMQAGEEPLIEVEEMKEEDATQALESQKVDGIFYAGESPSLTVAAVGMKESVLQSLLESYTEGKRTVEKIASEHPEGLGAAVRELSDYKDMVRQVSLGGKTINGNSQFFYALIAMACMYGCFIGFGSAITLQANLSPLAARRCITPTHKLKLVFSEMLASFGIHFLNVVILLLYLKYILGMEFDGEIPKMLLVILVGSMLGVSMGIFVSSAGRLGEGIKIGILLGISMVCSFLSGLMEGTMKDIIERHCPIINRINPAALISDAFYCINVYDDPARYSRNLITLVCMALALTVGAFLIIRRERYDSI